MTVYIDAEYCCHAEQTESRRPVENAFFDGKCPAFIAGWRFVPEGESWTDEQGRTFQGQALFPAATYAAPAAAQAQFERDEEAHTAELAALIEEIYHGDREEIGDVQHHEEAD